MTGCRRHGERLRLIGEIDGDNLQPKRTRAVVSGQGKGRTLTYIGQEQQEQQTGNQKRPAEQRDETGAGFFGQQGQEQNGDAREKGERQLQEGIGSLGRQHVMGHGSHHAAHEAGQDPFQCGHG